jgi:hypothetical protein
MMQDIIFQTTFIKGATGNKGDTASFEVPTNGVIAYDGDDIPEGYILTEAPASTGVSFNVMNAGFEIVDYTEITQ